MQQKREIAVVDDRKVAAPRLTLHHVGVLARDFENARNAYLQLGATVSEPVTISSQGVRVCFVDMHGMVAIELVEAIGNSVMRDLLKRGITYYHLGYMVPDFDAAVGTLEAMDYVRLEVFRSEAFEGRRCAFLMSPVLHLIEIIEQSS